MILSPGLSPHAAVQLAGLSTPAERRSRLDPLYTVGWVPALGKLTSSYVNLVHPSMILSPGSSPHAAVRLAGLSTPAERRSRLDPLHTVG